MMDLFESWMGPDPPEPPDPEPDMMQPCTTARGGDASRISTPVVLGVLHDGLVHAVITGYRYPNGETLSFYLMCQHHEPFDPILDLAGGPVVGERETTTCLHCLVLMG